MRRMNAWRSGVTANVYAVDQVLSTLGLHLSEVPDDVFIDDSPRRWSPPYSVKDQKQALALLRDNPVPVVARKLGLNPRTIRYWAQRAGMETVRCHPIEGK